MLMPWVASGRLLTIVTVLSVRPPAAGSRSFSSRSMLLAALFCATIATSGRATGPSASKAGVTTTFTSPVADWPWLSSTV